MQSVFMKARASLEAKGVFAHGAVPEAIADSWHRCLSSGLNPLGDPVNAVLSYQELRETRQRNERLIALVRPELELLSNQIAGTNYMTALADGDGVVLDAIMDSEFDASECSSSIRVGSIWREDLRGTNALGLALHTGETSMVTGGEHFFAKHGKVSCVSAPIFDSQGQIVGLLDASSEVAARQFHTQALVSLAATNIENRLFVDEHRGDHIIQFHPREEYLTTQSVGMISADDDGRITGVNRRAGEILQGLELGTVNAFADLFRGGFGAALKPMASGEVIRLVDWLNSTYFARIRMTRRHSGASGAKRAIALSVPAVFSMTNVSDAPVFRDDQVHNSLRLAVRSARLGSPFSIVGAPGTGRTTLAQTVHDEFHKDRPLIVVDCRTANALGEAERLMADILGNGDSDAQTFSVRSGGTLLLEQLALIHGGAAEKLAQVTNRLLQLKNGPGWVIISTADAGAARQGDWPSHVKMALSHLTQMAVHLPALSDRTDFAQIASFILAGISPGHRLSNTALEALKKFKRPQNLKDLTNQLRVLAVQCPVGVIREEHVERHLGQSEIDGQACSRCNGNPAREAKCQEINRVFRQCNSNVALAARKLGVSRNTVYSHIPD
ncbi:GAF domain-containing protein [Nitratireductor aquimarinus]|uniref:sigma-54-dependent Fis family transcriptional regulator n=1 Tax=Nitratireductor aquimarinus TaxID=889300 RepID=UPI0029360081|nr:GAF domain-containing protein [Nitratireductor aquimarinus]MDV2966698.1 GAF domain-containing protein [Nitratireductor aquimarinus]